MRVPQGTRPQVSAKLTTGSRSIAASSPAIVFCTKARFDRSADGKACGEEYVLVGRFSYAVHVSVYAKEDSGEAEERQGNLCCSLKTS